MTETPGSAVRILYVVTGAIQAAMAPARVKWLVDSEPGIEVIVGITPMALRFTTLDALKSIGRSSVVIDDWAADNDVLHHVELAAWPDAAIVHPLTFDYTGRLAAGLADAPVLLALQMTQAPVVLCPSFPPGLWSSPIAQGNLQRLALRDNVVVLPAGPAQSAQTGERFTGAAAPFEHALDAARQLIDEARGGVADAG